MARADHSPGGLKNTHALPHHNRKRASGSGRPKSSATPEPADRYLEVPSAVPQNPVAITTTANPGKIGDKLEVPPQSAANFSLSPLPSQASMSFDVFAPTLAGSDPFASRSNHNMNMNMNMNMGMAIGMGMGMTLDMMGMNAMNMGIGSTDTGMGDGTASCITNNTFQNGPGIGSGNIQNDMTMMNIDFLQPSPFGYGDEIFASMQSLTQDWPDVPGEYSPPFLSGVGLDLSLTLVCVCRTRLDGRYPKQQ
jgi:hypothetical protein